MNKKLESMRDSGFRRRAALAGLGLGLAPWMLPSLAGRARAATPPKRLVILWGHHGPWYSEWKMNRGGTPDKTWEFSLSDAAAADATGWSAPLKTVMGHRSRLLVVDGLGMLTAFHDSDSPGNEHSKGQAHSMTGANSVGDAVAGGASIDQIVATKLQQAGQLKSLELTVGDNTGLPYLWAGRAQRLPSSSSAEDAYDRLFGSFTPPTTMPGSGPVTVTDADRIAAAQKNLTGFVRDQYTSIAGTLGGADKQRVEAHRDMLSDLQRMFGDGTTMTNTGAAAACMKPTRAGASGYNQKADVMIKLVTAALACDRVRVVSLQLPQVPNSMVGVSDSEDLHNKYIHSNTAGVTTKETVIYGQIYAKLLDALAAVPEAGGSMLDNTLCVWAHELATGAHDFFNYPVVLAGLGGTLKLGRYLHLAQNVVTPLPHANWNGLPAFVGPGHNRMWVSVANAVGVDIDQVGEASVTDAKSGTVVSLKGAIPELRA